MAGFGSVENLLGILLQIVLINLVLSGDNALVIALACRSLPPQQQKLALALGGAGLVILMTILTAFATYLLSLPYVELGGAVLLVWIGAKLMVPPSRDGRTREGAHLVHAVRTIIAADIVMSFDNVLGMAGAAKGHLGLLVVGLLVTIPLMLLCSAAIVRLFEHFPVLVLLGGALLGYVAGEMAVGDPAVGDWIGAPGPYFDIGARVAGAALVVALGKLLVRRASRTVAAAEGHRGAE